MSVQPIPYNGPVPTNTNGVLTCMVQQVSDQSPYYDQDRGIYRAKFKGPYSKLKNCQNTGGKWLADALATFTGLSAVSRFSHPTPPAGYGWWVTGAQVEETEAGDHAILTLVCEARDNTPTPSGQLVNNPYHDTWQLRWEAYTLKPTAFCSNQQHYDYSFTDPAVEEGHPLTGYASRDHIDMFLNCNDKGVAKGHRWYADDQGSKWFMNDAENFITNKTLEDKSALWHYPVLTHTTVQECYVDNLSAMLSNVVAYSTTIGEKIDYIVGGSASPKAAPDGCPYTFSNDPQWIWVKTGDDMVHTKSKAESKVSF